MMHKQLYCGSSCVKYILEKYSIDTLDLKMNMTWTSELALCLKKYGISNIRVYFSESKLYNDFKIQKGNLDFEGFKYLEEISKQNISMTEKSISNESLLEEIDSCKYMILCVESKVFNNDASMLGGHFIILNGRYNDDVNVINPIKEKYERKEMNIDFLVKACKNFGAWRITIMEGYND